MPKSKLTHYADKTIEYLFYALFFFTPLILWPGTSEVFEFNKMLFVYLITVLIAASWTLKWIDQKKITLRRTPLDLPILLFLASQILSTIFSIDTHTSLYGYYSRFHGGLISTISYITLYYAFVSNIQLSAISYQLYAILGSATLVSLYGILEHLGIDKNLWVQDVQNRIFSTLGQPNWLSAYLVAILPLPIFLCLKQKSKKLTAVYCLLTAIFLITIFFTKSQSGIGATIIILSSIIVYFLGRKFKAIYLVLIPFTLVLIFYKWSFFQKISPLGPPNLGQLIEQNNQHRLGGSDSLLIRQVVWQGARQIGLQNPLFGTGVETFGYSYFTVRSALHNLLSEWEFLYNKAHNEYLNMLANTGFLGLSTYLFLILTAMTFLKSQISNLKSQISPALFFGYLSILITNYFGFSVVPIALFFFLFPAISIVESNQHKKYLSINFNLNSWLTLPALLFAGCWLLTAIYSYWTADLAYNRGKQDLGLNYLKPSLDNLQKATQISPTEPLYWSQLAEAEAVAAASVKAQLDAPDASISAEIKQSGTVFMNNLMAKADENSTKAVSMNPHHTNFYKSRAKVQLYLGTIDPKYNSEALQTLLKLTEISPTDAKVTYNIGLLYEQFGQTLAQNESSNPKTKVLGSNTDTKSFLELARNYFQKSLDLKPDYLAAQDKLK